MVEVAYSPGYSISTKDCDLRTAKIFSASVLLGLLGACGAPVADEASVVAGSTVAGSTAAGEPETTVSVDAGPGAAAPSRSARVRARTVETRTAVTGAAVTRPVPASGCAAVSGARVFGAEAPYSDHPEGLQLTAGRWTAGGEKLVAGRPCTTGRLENLDATATLTTLTWSTDGTTGSWWALALCAPGKSGTQCTVQDVLDDREPIQSVTITGGDAVVVYLTRTADVPAAGVNIRRTATYHYHVHSLVQTGYHDEPYTP